MRRPFIGLFFIFALSACNMLSSTISSTAEFWRPISEPNILLPIEQAQTKLNFDISQCKCGIFPANVTQPDQIAFQKDYQRIRETGVTITEEDSGGCVQRPSLVVAECMRARGWEITNCSGRMPVAGGGALCAGYKLD